MWFHYVTGVLWLKIRIKDGDTLDLVSRANWTSWSGSSSRRRHQCRSLSHMLERYDRGWMCLALAAFCPSNG